MKNMTRLAAVAAVTLARGTCAAPNPQWSEPVDPKPLLGEPTSASRRGLLVANHHSVRPRQRDGFRTPEAHRLEPFPAISNGEIESARGLD